MHRLHAFLGVHVKTPSAIIHDFYVARPFIRLSEADAPLRFDPNTVLPGAVAAQRFQPVARQRGKVAKSISTLSSRTSRRAAWGTQGPVRRIERGLYTCLKSK